MFRKVVFAMAMFDYGKDAASNDAVYSYQYTKSELESGYYPIDNFKEIRKYDKPFLDDLYGMMVYGEVVYTKPLSEEQCSAYEFIPVVLKPSLSNTVSQSEPKPVSEVPVVAEEEKSVGAEFDDIVQLKNVNANRIFHSKNPDYKIMSMRDGRSENGYANFVVRTDNMKQNENGTYDVVLGGAGALQNISLVKDGKSFWVKTTVDAIKEQFEQTLVSPNQKSESAKNVYMDMVDTKFVRSTKNPNYKVISIPFSGSENGYAKITVSGSNISDSVVNGKSVPNHVNINLGVENGTMPVSLKKNGTFVQEFMSVEKLADLQKQAVESWKKYSSQKSQDIAETEKNTQMQYDGDDEDVYE